MMVGRVVLQLWLEEELSMVVMVVGGGVGVDNSTPGQGAGDDLLPECGKKLEREREAATAPHS